MRMITKEDIEKAEAELVSKQYAAYVAVDAVEAYRVATATAATADAAAAVDAVWQAGWDNYQKLKKEYQNGKG